MTSVTTYDRIAENYDAGYEGARWEIYDDVTLTTFLGLLAPERASRILDAGAGTGKFALKLLGRGHDVTLLEPSSSMLEVARRKIAEQGMSVRASFIEGGIEAIPAADASFDAVFCEGDPLSYCRDGRAGAARELLRVLRPGGALYVSCDNRLISAIGLLMGGRIEEALETAETGLSSDPYGVAVHAFSPAELRTLLEDAGACDVHVLPKLTLSLFMPESALRDEALRARVSRLERQLAGDPGVAALGGHLQAIARAPGGGAL